MIGETVPKGSNVADTPSINDGTLNYKGPGLVKYAFAMFWVKWTSLTRLLSP